jgi:hypothetical protein
MVWGGRNSAKVVNRRGLAAAALDGGQPDPSASIQRVRREKAGTTGYGWTGGAVEHSQPCRQYQRHGSCSWGDRCKYRHDGQASEGWQHDNLAMGGSGRATSARDRADPTSRKSMAHAWAIMVNGVEHAAGQQHRRTSSSRLGGRLWPSPSTSSLSPLSTERTVAERHPRSRRSDRAETRRAATDEAAEGAAAATRVTATSDWRSATLTTTGHTDGRRSPSGHH